MKPDKNKLDDFLRQKVEQADFPYKEEYWQKMSAILDERDSRKSPIWRRGLYLLLGLLMIGITALYMLGVFGIKNKPSETPVPGHETTAGSTPPSLSQNKVSAYDQHNDQSNQTTAAAEEQVKDTAPVSHVATGIRETKQAAANDNKTNKQTNDLTSTQSADTTTNTPNHADAPVKPVAGTNETQVASVHPVPTLRKANQRKNDASAVERTKEGEDKQSLVKRLEKKVQGSLSRKAKADRQPGTLQHDDKQEVKKQASHTDEALVSQTAPTGKYNTDQAINVGGRLMKGTDTSRFTRRVELDPSKTNPRYVPNLGDYVPVRLDSITVITLKQAIPGPVSVPPAATAAKPDDAPKPKFTPMPYEYLLLAGLNMNKGWTGNASSPVSWAYSPYLGLGIGRQLAQRMTLTLNAGLTYLNGLNTVSSVTSYQYGFGRDTVTLSVAYKKLLQLFLPFSMYYRLASNHFLMLALGATWSMDVSGKVTETKTVNTGFPGNAAKQAVSTSSTQAGYRSGFNPFDVYAQIGYAYQLKNRYMLQLSVQQGFVDQTKNQYFGNNLRNTQSRISLGLTYTLH